MLKNNQQSGYYWDEMWAKFRSINSHRMNIVDKSFQRGLSIVIWNNWCIHKSKRSPYCRKFLGRDIWIRFVEPQFADCAEYLSLCHKPLDLKCYEEMKNWRIPGYTWNLEEDRPKNAYYVPFIWFGVIMPLLVPRWD